MIVRFPTPEDTSTLSPILGEAMGPGRIGSSIHHFAEVTSTNTLAGEWGRLGAPTGLVILADHQTEGRGRGDHVWISHPGDSLCFSIILRPERPIAELYQATLVAAVGVHEGLARHTGLDAGIKWPNDLLVGGRKICGILCELATEPDGEADHLIVGIGLNVRTPDGLPSDVLARTTSVAAETGRAMDRFPLLTDVLAALDEWFGHWESRGFSPVRQAWLQHSSTIGQQVTFGHGAESITGIATDLGEDGSLGIREESGAQHRFHFGEIRFAAEGGSETVSDPK